MQSPQIRCGWISLPAGDADGAQPRPADRPRRRRTRHSDNESRDSAHPRSKKTLQAAYFALRYVLAPSKARRRIPKPGAPRRRRKPYQRFVQDERLAVDGVLGHLRYERRAESRTGDRSDSRNDPPEHREAVAHEARRPPATQKQPATGTGPALLTPRANGAQVAKSCKNTRFGGPPTMKRKRSPRSRTSQGCPRAKHGA